MPCLTILFSAQTLGLLTSCSNSSAISASRRTMMPTMPLPAGVSNGAWPEQVLPDNSNVSHPLTKVLAALASKPLVAYLTWSDLIHIQQVAHLTLDLDYSALASLYKVAHLARALSYNASTDPPRTNAILMLERWIAAIDMLANFADKPTQKAITTWVLIARWISYEDSKNTWHPIESFANFIAKWLRPPGSFAASLPYWPLSDYRMVHHPGYHSMISTPISELENHFNFYGKFFQLSNIMINASPLACEQPAILPNSHGTDYMSIISMAKD